MANTCYICLKDLKAKRHGVYRKGQKDIQLLYEACPSCHGRLVKDSIDFGNPEWPKKQQDLEKKYKKK